MNVEKNLQSEQQAKKTTETELNKEKEQKQKIQKELTQKTIDHENAKSALKQIVSVAEEKKKEEKN